MLLTRLHEARPGWLPVHPDTLLMDVAAVKSAAFEGIPPAHVTVNLLGGWQKTSRQPMPLEGTVLPVPDAAKRAPWHVRRLVAIALSGAPVNDNLFFRSPGFDAVRYDWDEDA